MYSWNMILISLMIFGIQIYDFDLLSAIATNIPVLLIFFGLCAPVSQMF